MSSSSLLPVAPQSRQPDISGWRSELGLHSAHNSNRYEALVPSAVDPDPRNSLPTPSSTAYEPSHLESDCEKRGSIDEPCSFQASMSSWTLEIIAIIISIGAVASIVALLYRENGKPLTSWKLNVTLNTVVAALGTLARTTLAFALSACIGQQKWNWLRRKPDTLVAWEIFDEASRGPWGGTRLFVWLRARHWAALGALVTVGAIAFDPFLQAVIGTHGQLDSIPANADATIGQSSRIQSGLIQRINGVARAVTTSTGQFGFVETIGSRPDFGFISSVYNGFQNTSSFRNDAIGAECSTGNCTWSVFTSAAVCSSCKDVSSHMKRIKMSGKNGTNIPTLGSLNRYQGDFVRFELPYANIRNYVGLVQDGQQELMSNRTIRTHMTANTTIDANKTVLFKDSETLLMAFIVMRATDEFLDQHVKWEDSQPTATECALYLCANAYETKSESNVMKEHILGSWAHKVPGSYGIDWDSGAWEPGPGAVGWVKDFGSKLYEAQIDRTDLQILIPSETSNHLPQDVRRVFNISHEFIFSAIDFLIDYTKSDKTLNNPLHRGPPDETWNMMGVPWQTTSMPAVLDALWNSTNLTTTFDNVATSLTNQIRNSSPDRHQGELQKWILHVNVDWAYLAYPIFMLVTGIVYVILTIIESTRLRMPVWKESALPTLLHGFDDETQRLLRGESKAAQRKVLVRFAKDEKDCLRLIT